METIITDDTVGLSVTIDTDNATLSEAATSAIAEEIQKIGKTGAGSAIAKWVLRKRAQAIAHFDLTEQLKAELEPEPPPQPANEIPDYGPAIHDIADAVRALAEREIPQPVVPKTEPMARRTVISERDEHGRPSVIDTFEYHPTEENHG